MNSQVEEAMEDIQNYSAEILIVLETDKNTNLKSREKPLICGKSLKYYPQFTIKEIEYHRKSRAKNKNTAIKKTFERGKRFKPERFTSAGSIYTSYTLTYVIVKAKCKASMKNEVRDLMVYISRLTSSVRKAYC